MFDGGDLVHHVLVNVQAACRVDYNKIVEVAGSIFNRFLCGFNGILRPAFENGNIDLFTHDLKLGDRGRAIYVACNKQRFFALSLCKVGSKLARHCGFARTLKTRKQENRGFARPELNLHNAAADELSQLLIDNFDYLLGRSEALENIRTHCPRRNSVYKGFHNRKVNIRLEQRKLYLAHCLFDFFFGQLALSAQFSEYVLKF